MNFAELFVQATGHKPYPWQTRLAAGDWPDLLDIPTGLGKTQGVLAAWLHKRLNGDSTTGRRLVWCLPMRGLVEQTGMVATAMVQAVESAWTASGRAAPTVHLMLGGDISEAWELDPGADAIIVGTQDLLLSRALNRGYAMSRYKWPVHFGLLHNDVCWVYDETQLLGVGLETSAQLQGFRESMGVQGPHHSLWMSATLAADRLSTVDHPADDLQMNCLGDDDLSEPAVMRRVGAQKNLQVMPELVLGAAAVNSGAYAKKLAGEVAALHASRGGLTLVVLNQVSRAQAVFREVRAALPTDVPVVLVHSRFRPADRRTQEAVLHAEGDRVVVATQVVEAGMDLSSNTLITELAPWPSLVQRMGRCNRFGTLDDATVYWVDADLADDAVLRPYDAADLQLARGALSELAGAAGPGRLRELTVATHEVLRPILRRKDLLALFDTAPDISGEELDIGRYVRDGDDTDVFFHWLDDLGAQRGQDVEPPVVAKDALCRVGLGAAGEFLAALAKRHKKAKPTDAHQLEAQLWDPLNHRWQKLQTGRLRPGMVIALNSAAGGYAAEQGWLGKDSVAAVPMARQKPETVVGTSTSTAHDDDIESATGCWVLLEHHLAHVRDEAKQLAEVVAPQHAAHLATAGLWHDVGKAHAEFQGRLLDPVADDPQRQPPNAKAIWAKSNHRLRSSREQHRRYFRHELASALGWLAHGGWVCERERDLVAYLVLAHHGKVRVSLRSLPDERPPSSAGDCLLAHGVMDGDVIDQVVVPGVGDLSGLHLDLGLMQMGASGAETSWLQRVLALRDAADLGPFRLAFMEAVVRVADWTASAREQQGGYGDA